MNSEANFLSFLRIETSHISDWELGHYEFQLHPERTMASTEILPGHVSKKFDTSLTQMDE